MPRLLTALLLSLSLAFGADTAFADDPPPTVDAGLPVDASVKPDAGDDGAGGIATSPGVVTQAPDPTKDPSGTISAIGSAKEHAGYIGAGVLVLYILAALAVRASGHVGWFAQGRRLAIVVGVTGVLGALSDHFLKGADWQTVATAAYVGFGVFLVPLHPNAADGSATAAGTPTGKPPSIPGHPA